MDPLQRGAPARRRLTDPSAEIEAAERFIRTNLSPRPVPDFPDIQLYAPTPASGLARLGARAPYWAYVWAGGAALAEYLRRRPETVAGRRVLDLGCGSGLVGIAAAKTGAAAVTACDLDPHAVAATRLNAAINGVPIAARIEAGEGADVVLAEDVFYDAEAAVRSLGVLSGLRERGCEILIGDPGRATLPVDRLRPIATYEVRDFGSGHARVSASVWTLSGDAG